MLFLKKVPVNHISVRQMEQLSGAGTSVGAHYGQADDAPSKKAYRNAISTCKRGARESKFFIMMIAKVVSELRDEARPLWQESKELHLIFAKIYRGNQKDKRMTMFTKMYNTRHKSGRRNPTAKDVSCFEVPWVCGCLGVLVFAPGGRR